MGVNLRIDGLMVLTAAAVAGGVLLYVNRGALAKGVQAAAQKVNPGSTGNVVYQGVNAVGDVADNGTDDDSFSLGAWVWELTHPEQVKRESEIIGGGAVIQPYTQGGAI